MARIHHARIGRYDVVTIVTEGPWKENCYLIGDAAAGEMVVVDPGSDGPELVDAVRQLGFTVTAVLITHGHPDHVGGAARLAAEFDVDCRLSLRDQRTLRHAPAYAAAFGRVGLRLPDRLRFFDDAEELHLGDEAIRILPTPGHTPGSVAIQVGRLILTGDTLFRERVGRTDLPGGDAVALAASVDRILAVVSEETPLLPGHGRPTTGGEARAWWLARGRAASAAGANS